MLAAVQEAAFKHFLAKDSYRMRKTASKARALPDMCRKHLEKSEGLKGVIISGVSTQDAIPHGVDHSSVDSLKTPFDTLERIGILERIDTPWKESRPLKGSTLERLRHLQLKAQHLKESTLLL